jgi:hypothetical protein
MDPAGLFLSLAGSIIALAFAGLVLAIAFEKAIARKERRR